MDHGKEAAVGVAGDFPAREGVVCLVPHPAALQEQTLEQSVDTSEWLLPISETLGWGRKSMWTRDLFWSQDQEDPLVESHHGG